MPGDTIKEIEELQNKFWMKRPTFKRAEFMFGMFATVRGGQSSLRCRKICPIQEFKRQLYYRTYGEHLSEDFFKE